jgi:hypothetical protein
MAKTLDKKTLKARKENAKRQRLLRAERDRKKLCRTCGKPAVKSARTGRLSRSCSDHLGRDKQRKEVERIVELPWRSEKSRPSRNGGSTAFVDELRWMKG